MPLRSLTSTARHCQVNKQVKPLWLNRRKENKQLKQLELLRKRYQTPLCLSEFLFPLGEKGKEAAQLLCMIAPVRMMYCLQAIADPAKVSSEQEFQCYFAVLYQYYLFCNYEFTQTYIRELSVNQSEYMILQEMAFHVMIHSMNKEEWRNKLCGFATCSQLMQLYDTQTCTLQTDGPIIFTLLKNLFPDIIQQLECHKHNQATEKNHSSSKKPSLSV